MIIKLVKEMWPFSENIIASTLSKCAFRVLNPSIKYGIHIVQLIVC